MLLDLFTLFMHSLHRVEASNHHFCFHFYPLIEQPSTSVIHNRTAPFTSLYKRIPTLQWHWPVQHSVISFAYQGLQFGVDKGKAGKCCLVHGVNQHLVTVGQPRLLVQELSIKVAAVTGGFLGRKGRGLQSDCDYKFHCGTIDRHSHKITHEEEKSLARTTLGLNGGSTSLFSSAVQLIVLKNGCARMSPTTPNLRLGSRSNSLKKEEDTF